MPNTPNQVGTEHSPAQAGNWTGRHVNAGKSTDGSGPASCIGLVLSHQWRQHREYSPYVNKVSAAIIMTPETDVKEGLVLCCTRIVGQHQRGWTSRRNSERCRSPRWI